MTGKDDPRGPGVTDGQGEAALENELRMIARYVDPVPMNAVHVARESHVWRTIDAELADLVYDSLVDQDEPALTRGAGEPRLLTFQAGEFTIEIEATGDDTTCDLFGQIVPAGPRQVQLHHPDGPIDLAVDDLGRFGHRGIRSGPVRVQFRVPGEASDVVIVTQWVPL